MNILNINNNDTIRNKLDFNQLKFNYSSTSNVYDSSHLLIISAIQTTLIKLKNQLSISKILEKYFSKVKVIINRAFENNQYILENFRFKSDNLSKSSQLLQLQKCLFYLIPPS